MQHLIPLFLLLVYLICFSNEKIDFNQNTINDSILHYSELAHNYYQAGELESSREALIKLQQYGDIRRLKDVILKKRLFFVPTSFDPPLIKEISGFILKPIKASHAELDYKAVMGSAEHLTGVLGRRDWPGDLTLEEDRYALEGHEWEFHNRIGFVYTIMNSKETEIVGCLYI